MRKISYLPFTIIISLWYLLDWYAFQGVYVLFSKSGSQTQTIAHVTFWALTSAVLFIFIISFYKYFPSGKLNLLFNTVFNGFITLFITKLVFVIMLASEDIYRLISALIVAYPARSQVWSQIALVISSIPFSAFLFGVTRGKYHYKVHRTALYVDNLPDSFNGFTITQISDIHSGSLDSIGGVQKGIDLINRQESDLLVFTGDLVNNKASEVEPWIPFFSQIKAKYGKFSVLGNHDYGDYVRWDSLEEKANNLYLLKANHGKMGFRLLLDEHVVVEKGGDCITLIGVENWGLGFGQRGNLAKALAGIDRDSVKILLSHDPSHWDTEVKHHPVHINLTLSGHTHGMQFGIELFGFKWSPVKYRYRNWAGLAHEKGRYLYVNRGFGFLGFAGRVGIWPEITVIELRKK